MKRVLIPIIFACVALTSTAQNQTKTGTNDVSSKAPEYAKAQNELSQLSIRWMKEIESKYNQVTLLQKSYFADESSLTPKMKKERQDEIKLKEVEAQNLQKQYFGINGDLSKKREALIKPLEDKLQKPTAN
jgi:outer membrane protein